MQVRTLHKRSMADRRRARVQYDDAEPLPVGQSDPYESERRYRSQDRWSDERRSWSRDAHNGPREDQRRPSWRDSDRGHRSWSARDSGRYRHDYGRRDRGWGDRRSDGRDSHRDSRSSTREQSPERPRAAEHEPKRDAPRKDTPLSGDVDHSEADQMAAMMGFGSFGTSKGKQVEDNSEGFAEIKKEHSWRQYMNRKGGFNRPLDKVQ